jgi:PAS domain S-box-containing protein
MTGLVFHKRLPIVFAATLLLLLLNGVLAWWNSSLLIANEHWAATLATLALETLLAAGLLMMLAVVVRQDLRQRTRAEETLRASERRFRLLADALPQMVWTTNGDGRLDYCNQRWREYSGLSLEQSVGRGADQAIHPDDREVVARAWQRALQTGKAFQTEFRLRRRADGSYRWHLGRAVPVRADEWDPKGGLIGWFGTSTDIEDQKRAEQAVQQANEELERRVAERTAQLLQTNEELRQATLLAETASRTKSEFLASISHEIRTPMNGILGMTEMALDTKLTEQQRTYLNVVKVSAQALLALLNDILDFSKIEAGKMELNPTPLALRQELQATLEPLALRAASKGLRWQCTVSPETPDLLLGDVIRLRQVLLNLVSNAVKFTEHGEVRVVVAAEGISTPEPKAVLLHFTVVDTGIGIAADKLRAIFNPFVQADGSLSRKYGGTGLGLTIASRLVEMMGGRIEVASAVGQGSTFSFSILLPLSPPQSPAEAAQTGLPAESRTGHEETAGTDHSPSASLRILLVEDNVFNQQVGVFLLQRQGHSVVVADSGAAALKCLAEAAYDLVLMDVQMPAMDGLETTQAIRQQEASTGRRLPIVALTAHASRTDQQRCLEAGMDGYLCKPLEPSLLEQIIRQVRTGVLDDRAGWQAPAAAAEPEPIFDSALTLERLSGNRHLLVEVSNLFAESATNLLGQMRTAMAAKDLPALRRAAHTLKGSVSFFTAPSAVEAARRVEKVGDNFLEAEEALQALTSVVERLRSALVSAAQEKGAGEMANDQ